MIAEGAIARPLLTWLLILVCLFGGLWGFASVGRLEDPAFTIKQAVVITRYPGASSYQVAAEVSEVLESAIQQMGQVDFITSRNRPGVSQINVEMQSTYDGDELTQIWDELRNKVRDAVADLPPGAQTPVVNDGFGDVYGLFYAVTMRGFSDAERHAVAAFLRRELLTVDGVADIELAGLPEEAIYIDLPMARLAALGLDPNLIVAALTAADSVTSAGARDAGTRRVRVADPTAYDTVASVAGLSIGVGGDVFNLRDIATISRARRPEPGQIIRYDGVEAFTLGVAGLADENIVDVGARVDARIDALLAELPAGVELHPVYQQHVVVDRASNDFIVNLALSVSIVIGVLCLFMGWRAGVVVGATLLLTVLGTLLFMGLLSIEMERISLGALIIAMGMLVDNAIVVAEGMQTAMRRGADARSAARDVAGRTQTPLLGATVIGILAFAGIGLSPDATGEFLFSLFAVIAISLLLSWVLAVTVTPLFAHYLFRRSEGGSDGGYDGAFFRGYKALLGAALTGRRAVIALLIAVTASAVIAFGAVRQQFFPNSNTPLFYLHYQLPQGTSINAVAADLAELETWLGARDEVVSVASFAGGGATRFMLTYAPQDANPSYGHMIVRTAALAQIPALRRDLDEFTRARFPDAEARTERLVFGPGGGAKIELRLSGPQPDVLRALAEEAERRMREASSELRDLRDNWRERELVLLPLYAEDRAQAAGVSRDAIATALLFATDGARAALYREDERLIPVVLRVDERERAAEDALLDTLVYSAAAGGFVPLAQVVDGIAPVVQDTLLYRRDRVPTLTVQADVAADANANDVFAALRAPLEAMPLPPGYRAEWGGEYENSTKAQAALGRQLPLAFLVMVLITIVLFGALRQALVVWLLVPMAICGVAFGLLLTGLPFSFTALLGLLSLSGMLLKNGIVLVEEIDLQREAGLAQREAIVSAGASRLRPVALAAVTTILGMLPLLWDAFFASMAVTIMAGLAFATLLTLFAAPLLYHTFFRAERRAAA